MAETPDSHLPFLIAGGGIGGLSVALALARTGRASIVFEKRSLAHEDGAGIQIGPNGVRALLHLGVDERLRPVVSAPDALQVMDGVSGQRVTRMPLGNTIEARHGAPYWTAHRADLHAALCECASENALISISHNAAVADVSEANRAVTVTLDDGTQHHGTALIAADGLWSTIRHKHFETPSPVFTGKRALRSIVPMSALPSELKANDTHIWLRPSLHAVHYPIRNGAEIALIIIVANDDAAEGWNHEVSEGAAAKIIAPLPDALRCLASEAPAWRSWPLMSVTGVRSWTRGRVALLGDAAHPVLPFMAQGAVLAMEDAVVLAQCVSHEPDCAQAFKAYQTIRQPRAAQVAETSAQNGRIYHLSQPMAALRNAALKLAPPESVLARYDWIYGWRPDPDI